MAYKFGTKEHPEVAEQKRKKRTRYAIVHLNAGHTPNGNPKRCYVVYDMHEDGTIVGVYDEGYEGRSCIPDKYRKSIVFPSVELGTIKTTTAEYRAMLKNHPVTVEG